MSIDYLLFVLTRFREELRGHIAKYLEVRDRRVYILAAVATRMGEPAPASKAPRSATPRT